MILEKPRILIDSSVWIEFFSKGAKYLACKNVLDSSENCGVPSIVVFEVCKKISTSVSATSALSVAAYLRQFKILNLTDEVALFAIDLSLKYHLAMAESMVLAHAIAEDSTLVTLDNDFRKIPKARVI